MSWALHPTTEMPSPGSAPAGRHRRRRPGALGLAAIAAILALAGGAMVSPALLGWPPPSPPADVPPSIVAALPGLAASMQPSPTAASTTSLEEEVLALANAERAKQGCAKLRLDANLVASARSHSADMAREGYFDHTGRDGRDPGKRMRDAGYNTDLGWAENLARGQLTAEAVMARWMTSQEHRSNILNCSMRAIGIGTARASSGQLYWTQDLGGS